MKGKVSDHPESFQTIQKLSSPSGNFPDHPETFQTIWKSVHLGMSFNGGFHRYAQKLSGRAKTFQVAMPPWDMGFSDSDIHTGMRKYMTGGPYWPPPPPWIGLIFICCLLRLRLYPLWFLKMKYVEHYIMKAEHKGETVQKGRFNKILHKLYFVPEDDMKTLLIWKGVVHK